MRPMAEMDKNSILSDETLTEVFEQEDAIKKARLLIQLEDRATELGVKTKFQTMVRAYKRVDREMNRNNTVSMLDNWTNFTGPYDNMECGAWIAGDKGIIKQTNDQCELLACYHPILPLERLKNLETGEEQIKLAYKRNSIWNEIIVPKDIVSTASKITALSKLGISVTSENARLLVMYLSDVENLNDNDISVQYSTSKLGWLKGGFIPYDTDIIFDGDSRFRQVFSAISERGSYADWMKHVKKLRATGKIEIKFLLAASFASVILSIVGALPFFTDLWGETEGGKTITLMLAASIWANPDDSQYIGDFKTTDVALEARADLLNHLPVILDDTSKTSARIRDNFEGVVYDLCSGKGKSRSNKELGMNRENHWRNIFLTNGERPLNSYVNQGGAINRILEITCGDNLYSDPHETAEILKHNYGFAGKEFIQILKKLGSDKIKSMQQEIYKTISSDDKMAKQSMALSVVLTADRIATEYLFQDGAYIDLENAKKTLIDRNELSDNERCYQYVLGEVSINSNKFSSDSRTEIWGIIEDGYAVIQTNILTEMCERGGFSKKAFLNWADKNNLLLTDGNNQTKQKKVNGTNGRYVFLKLDPNDDGFINVDDQEVLPFD